MFEVFGYSLDALTLVQVGATTLIVGLYAALTSLGEQRAHHQSVCQMCLLVSFLIDEHPTVKSLENIVGVKAEDFGTRPDELMYFSGYYEDYKSSGLLPLRSRLPVTNVFEQFLFMLLSTIFGIWLVDDLRREAKRGGHLLRNTEIRKNYFSKTVLAAIGGIAFLLVAAGNFSNLFTVIMIACGVLAFVGAVASVFVLSFEQQSWKTYWTDRLTEILAAQDQEHAHDQFNRALLLSNFINEQPDVPFPGRLGLYTGVYSIVQGLILLIDSQLGGNA